MSSARTSTEEIERHNIWSLLHRNSVFLNPTSPHQRKLRARSPDEVALETGRGIRPRWPECEARFNALMVALDRHMLATKSAFLRLLRRGPLMCRLDVSQRLP